MTSVDITHQEILEYLRSELAQPVIEQSYPDYQTILRDEQGRIVPYVAVNFGDMQSNYVYNMATTRGDDYTLPVYIQVVGPTPEIARGVWSRVLDLLLGKTFTWAGEGRKRPGGNMWPIVNTDNATEAYTFACSFGFLIQYQSDV